MALRSSSTVVVLDSRSSWIWEWVVGMVEDWVVGEVSGGKYGSQILIGTRVINEKGGIQWDRCQIRVSQKGVGLQEKKD
jgi:hypothetical protein